MNQFILYINTGKLSLILGLLLIVACVVGFFAVYQAIKKKTIDGASLEQLIQLGKWIVVSVALVVVTAITADGFKEREQEIKELDYFDKYKDITLSTEGIDKKWLLADYFSIVSPSGPFKEAWMAYKESLRRDYADYERLMESQMQVRITKADSAKPQVLEQKNKTIDSIQALKMQINEKYRGITIINQTSLNGFKVDIFYLEELEGEAKPRAEKIYNLLVNKYPLASFQIKVLSRAKNAESGYRIQQNQIRYELSEADAFKDLQRAINEASISTNEPVAGLTISYYTPNYISVFIRNN